MVDQDDKRLKFIPVEQAVQAPDGLINHKDRWWVFDPDRGFLFWRPHKLTACAAVILWAAIVAARWEPK